MHWSPPSGTSVLLTRASIQHGFCGVHSEHPVDVHHAKQVHLTDIHATSDETAAETGSRKAGDGVFTTRPNTAVAVKTADCLPVLFATGTGQFCMAVHAGWRGLTAGILREAVQVASRERINIQDLLIAIGPAISRESFEVGPEVVQAILAMDMDAETVAWACSKGEKDRWHADLPVAAALHLVSLGIKPQQIEIIQACTKKLTGSWHSFRREGKNCGSNWSWIRTTS